MKLAHLFFAVIVLVPTTVVSANQVPATDKAYRADIEKWRKGQEADLMKPDGWLAVSGLFWLTEGDTTVGTAAGSKILLPKGSSPATVGTISLKQGHVTLAVAEGSYVTVNGVQVSTVELKSDSTKANVGDLVLMAIQRGAKTGIRLFDAESKGMREFDGMRWFGVDPNLRIHAKYTAYETPRTLQITNVLGDVSPASNPGYVEFTVDGKPCRLEAQAQGPGLFFNFHDLTSGHATYPAGRFLDAPAPKDGWVDLDFNKAVNPPCAFTVFATCPLPPKENFLNVAINAGEKTHHPVE